MPQTTTELAQVIENAHATIAAYRAADAAWRAICAQRDNCVAFHHGARFDFWGKASQARYLALAQRENATFQTMMVADQARHDAYIAWERAGAPTL